MSGIVRRLSAFAHVSGIVRICLTPSGALADVEMMALLQVPDGELLALHGRMVLPAQVPGDTLIGERMAAEPPAVPDLAVVPFPLDVRRGEHGGHERDVAGKSGPESGLIHTTCRSGCPRP